MFLDSFNKKFFIRLLLMDQNIFQIDCFHIPGRQLLPRFSYKAFDPRFQTVGFKMGHLNHVKSALFLYPILK